MKQQHHNTKWLSFFLGFFCLAGASQVHACALPEPQKDHADNHRQPGLLCTDREAPLPKDLVLIFGNRYMDLDTLYKHKDEWKTRHLFSPERGAFHIGVQLNDGRLVRCAHISWPPEQANGLSFGGKKGKLVRRSRTSYAWYKEEKLYDFISRLVVYGEVHFRREWIKSGRCVKAGTKMEQLLKFALEHFSDGPLGQDYVACLLKTPKRALSFFGCHFLDRFDHLSEEDMTHMYHALKNALASVVEGKTEGKSDFKRKVKRVLMPSEREIETESIVAFLQALRQKKDWDSQDWHDQDIIQLYKRLGTPEHFRHEVLYAKIMAGTIFSGPFAEAYPHLNHWSEEKKQEYSDRVQKSLQDLEGVCAEECLKLQKKISNCLRQHLGRDEPMGQQEWLELTKLRQACDRARFNVVDRVHQCLLEAPSNDSSRSYLAENRNVVCILALLFLACVAKPLHEAYLHQLDKGDALLGVRPWLVGLVQQAAMMCR